MGIFAPPLNRTLQELRDDSEERVWRRDIRSTGWDGGTDLSSVDTAATKGYFVDFSNDAAQFETLFYKGAAVGVWQAWVPTYANLTVGNGTVVARYVQIGDTVLAQFSLKFGSTSAMGTAHTISLPVTADESFTAPFLEMGLARMNENAVAVRSGYVSRVSSTTCKVVAWKVTTTYLLEDALTATIPFTWGTDDHITFNISYEAA